MAEVHEHSNRLTKDEVLHWLNDRVGEFIHVGFTVEPGDVPHEVLSASGELGHWTGSGHTSAGPPREDRTGLYSIGKDVSLDVTEIPLWLADARAEVVNRGDVEELRFPLGEYADLRVSMTREAGDA